MNKEKLFFKISELEELTGITSTKIRYWTKKYRELNSQLRETPNSTHKLYHKDSIEINISMNDYQKLNYRIYLARKRGHIKFLKKREHQNRQREQTLKNNVRIDSKNIYSSTIID